MSCLLSETTHPLGWKVTAQMRQHFAHSTGTWGEATGDQMAEGYATFNTAQTPLFSVLSERDYRATLPSWATGEAPSPAHPQEGCTRKSRAGYAEKYTLVISVGFLFLVIFNLFRKQVN